MREDRGYDPDIRDVEKQRQQQIILKLIERNNYTEGRGEEKSWKDWVLMIMAGVVGVGIPGTYVKITQMEVNYSTSIAILTEKVEAIAARTERVEKRLNP